MLDALNKSMINILGSLNLQTLLLMVTVLLMVYTLSKWHSTGDTDFDFRRALLDPETKTISFSRLGHFVSLVVSTALLLHEASKDRLTDWMFMGYMTAWAGTYVAAKAIASKTGQ